MHADPLVFVPVPYHLVFWGLKFLGIRGHLNETWQIIGVDGQFSLSQKKKKLYKNLHITTCNVMQYKYCCPCSVTCICTLYFCYVVHRSERDRGVTLAPQSPWVPAYNGNTSSWGCPGYSVPCLNRSTNSVLACFSHIHLQNACLTKHYYYM